MILKKDFLLDYGECKISYDTVNGMVTVSIEKQKSAYARMADTDFFDAIAYVQEYGWSSVQVDATIRFDGGNETHGKFIVSYSDNLRCLISIDDYATVKVLYQEIPIYEVKET